ncbi:uncharacterized protein LOC106094268 [Stomoxys calcitrans]|uniref:uncharacterized protein LOC106094268 n=1 Tax=Stomoxys calcitrans TaxID=35570 RepID=UPI0027E34FAD|nr:uncharacterized protein LOC106094268 [Stomoxys calcitrans]
MIFFISDQSSHNQYWWKRGCMRMVNTGDWSTFKRRRPRVYKERVDPFSIPDHHFKAKYRFKKSTAKKIIGLIKNDIELSKRGHGTPAELQVMVALRCWGRRKVQDDAGDLHGLAQPTVSRICNRVARALARHGMEYINMPTSLEEQAVIMRDFKAIRNFPGVIGAIDGTHVKIKKNWWRSCPILYKPERILFTECTGVR